VQARFVADSVTITGTSREFVRVGDEGTRSTFRFCPECGSIVYYTTAELQGFVTVPVGAFADPDFPAPGVSVYEERMHGWVSLPPNIDHMR
jgi:hypothetical protein